MIENERSEIARIRRRIELECEALRQALDGFAAVASHEAISHRYELLGICHEELECLVGETLAGDMVCEVYNRVLG